MPVENTVFISYRRVNVPWALLLYKELHRRGFNVFLDFTGLPSGDFEQSILENIRTRAHFLVVLTPSALERCDEPGDWLRREIEEAMNCGCNIVPLMFEGFSYGSPAVTEKLTGQLSTLNKYNGLNIVHEYFDAAIDKLQHQFLNIERDKVMHPASEVAQQAVATQQLAASSAPDVSNKELTAQSWFERGANTTDIREQINCYTEAIRLDASFAAAYGNRGFSLVKLGDVDGAISNYSKNIELDPKSAAAYSNRGVIRMGMGDLDGALNDCNTAIELNPNYAFFYTNRACVLASMKDIDGAIVDSNTALKIKPDFSTAYATRGAARYQNGDIGGSVSDANTAIDLDPNNALAYANRSISLADLGNLDKAMRDINKAIRKRCSWNRLCWWGFLSRGVF